MHSNAYLAIERLGALRPGWDGHGAAAIAAAARAQAATFLRRVESKFGSMLPEPMVAPLSDGGVALVWQARKAIGSVEVEIVFLERGNEYSVTERSEGRSFEAGENVEPDTLARIIDRYVVS
jgi:hypothetical protein